MKKLVILIAIFLINLSGRAQINRQLSVLIFPLTEHTIIKVNGKETKPDSVLIFSNNNRIEIIKGKLCLIDALGDEIIFKERMIINIKDHLKKEAEIKKAFNFNKISKFMNKPSVYLPNLYNNDRSEFVIFPVKSSVYDKSNIKFYFSQDFVPEMKFKLCLKDSDSLVFETDDFSKEFNLQNVILDTGKSYIWKLYNGSNSIKGYITMLDEEQIQKITKNSLNCKSDYLDMFLNFLENECKFDAMAILFAALKKYPESELMKNLYHKIVVD